MTKSIFRSAITGEDGEVDSGYLALFWGLIGWAAAQVVILVIGSYAVVRHQESAAETIEAIGTAIGIVSGGFATMLGAVGLFRAGDKERPPAPGSTTTTKVETETKVESEAAPAGTAAKPMPVVVKNPDPVPVRVHKAKKR